MEPEEAESVGYWKAVRHIAENIEVQLEASEIEAERQFDEEVFESLVAGVSDRWPRARMMAASECGTSIAANDLYGFVAYDDIHSEKARVQFHKDVRDFFGVIS